MNRHERRRARRETVLGKEVEVRDATEAVNVTMLGSNYNGPEVLGVNGVIEAIREYPNGTRASMGLCYLTDMKGKRVLTAETMVFAGPTVELNDPRNITPEGVLQVHEDNRAHLDPGPTKPQ